VLERLTKKALHAIAGSEQDKYRERNLARHIKGSSSTDTFRAQIKSVAERKSKREGETSKTRSLRHKDELKYDARKDEEF
jgi:hypothetical protein